jgi:hypothetical protein
VADSERCKEAARVAYALRERLFQNEFDISGELQRLGL